MRVGVKAAVVAATLWAVLGCAGATHASATPEGVHGYIESGTPIAQLRRNLPRLDSVGVDGVNLTTASSVSQPDPTALEMLAAARQAGKPAQLLVGNYNDEIGDFDPDLAHRTFATASNRAAVIAALVDETQHGWDGIELDFESLDGSDAAGLTAFTSQLRAALPQDKTLGMAVMASTSAQGYLDNAYDLKALAPSLNTVVLMAYDQHGPTWTSAGPIGSLPWARKSMNVMLQSVPREKAVLGVAGYGYTWPSRGTGTQLSDRDSRRAARRPGWSARLGEWHSSLRGGGTIWWSDARSLHVRERLANKLGVSGVAIWSLGLSDTLRR